MVAGLEIGIWERRRFHSELAISGGSRDDGHPKGILP
jgi:hypothetical protein